MFGYVFLLFIRNLRWLGIYRARDEPAKHDGSDFSGAGTVGCSCSPDLWGRKRTMHSFGFLLGDDFRLSAIGYFTLLVVLDD